MYDDILYYSSLLVCVILGSYYKKIENVEMKRNYGAGLGILVTCVICGHYIYHTILMVWGNIIIIKCCDKRVVHQLSLAYTWLYLMYLHYNLEDSKYVIWLHQNMALRLVGLAFEVNSSDKVKPDKGSMVNLKSLGDDIAMDPNAVDIISYAFFFIGLHNGPYFKWKIFNDHFQMPFSALGDCRVITEQKFKKAFICAVGFFLLQMKYSEKEYYDDDFYNNYGSDYRFIYNVPHLVMHFFQYQIVMMLCTSVCTETGFGVYPAKCQPLPGQGPTTQFSLLKVASGAPDVALEQEYNFAMLKCYDNSKLLIGPRMRDTMRGWDMSTRYWFWSNTFKSLIKSNKEVRSACSFLAWTIWKGPKLQHFIISMTLWLYVHLEAEYAQMYDTAGALKGPWDVGFSIMRLFCLIYLTPCFVITDTSTVLRYYNSIYWAYHFVLFVLILCAVVMYKNSLHAQLFSQLHGQGSAQGQNRRTSEENRPQQRQSNASSSSPPPRRLSGNTAPVPGPSTNT